MTCRLVQLVRFLLKNTFIFNSKNIGKRSRNNEEEAEEESSTSTQPRRQRTTKPYVPGYRTGGYAILLSLLDLQAANRTEATKDQICSFAQDYCDSSFTMPDAGKSYTAWTSIRTLCDKSYIWKHGKPAKYSLTDTGKEMAEKLRNPTSSGPSQSSSTQPSQSYAPESSFTSLNPSTARGRRNHTSSELDYSFLDTWSESSSASTPTYQAPPRTPAAPKKAQRGGKAGRGRGKKESTGAMLDRILAEMGGGDDDPSKPDMSLYVMNPSKHQTISLNGRTSTNTPNSNTTSNISTPNRSNTSTPNRSNIGNSNSPTPNRSNLGNSSTSSPNKSNFGSNISSPNKSNPSGNISSPNRSNPSSSNTSPKPKTTSINKTPTLNMPNRNNLKIPTKSASSVTASNRSSFAQRVSLAEDNNDFDDLYSMPKATPSKATPSSTKRRYNVDDYELDLTPSSLPTFKSSQPSKSEPDIVDLLSSPEPSPQFESQAEFDYFPLSQSRTEHIINETFHYTYLNAKQEPVRHVTMADTQMIDGQPAYLVKFFSKQAGHTKARNLMQQVMEGEYTTAYAYDDMLDTVCTGLPSEPVIPLHGGVQDQQNAFWPFESSTQNTNNSQVNTSSQVTNTQTAADLDALVESEYCERLLPSEYEIFLVIDNREIQMKTNRDYFQQRLASKGVHCLTRTLDLGDVLWIAKKKNSQAPTDELVLGYIIERKRLDDLVSSIKDGRFTEQKTRLKRSGADKVIYVVEEYNREEAERFGAQAIQTALSSTQIIDGIFLKRTNSIDETIDYLVSVTNIVKQIYKDTTLFSIPSHLISQQNYLDLKAAYKRKKQSKQEYLVNYPLFNSINAKGASTTLGDIYRHMLMTIRGVNAEKAISLMKVYPTPHLLLKAFDEKSPEEGKLLAKKATAAHITRRRWGVSVSEKLYQTWGASSYPNLPTSDDDE